jgi:site-specific DNA-methyltransferase (adenine-specific)
MTHNAFNADCMEIMSRYPDKWFDLACIDPPYGIDRGETFGGTNWKIYEKKKWDNERPNKKYFTELFRVSKNQIIWGANYLTEFLPPSMGWIFWDKGQDLTMSDGELAFSSFDRALRKKVINRCKISDYGGLLHPTQKPVALYDWIFKNYLPNGGRVLDTHGGSMSSLISAIKAGNIEMTISELDADYYASAQKRVNDFMSQLNLFQERPEIIW